MSLKDINLSSLSTNSELVNSKNEVLQNKYNNYLKLHIQSQKQRYLDILKQRIESLNQPISKQKMVKKLCRKVDKG